MPNGGGTLTAVYKYANVNIDNPNHMETQILSANGYGSDLDSNYYKLSYVDPNWDTTPDYDASGSVAFHMSTLGGFIWFSSTITNHCQFDSYGITSMSWS